MKRITCLVYLVCNNGSLSGSYTMSSCSVQGVSPVGNPPAFGCYDIGGSQYSCPTVVPGMYCNPSGGRYVCWR